MNNYIHKSKLIKIGLVATIAVSLLGNSIALADSSGPRDAGTGSNVAGVGTIDWTSPGNITTAGTPYATANLTTSAISKYLQGTNYGFNGSSSIPSGATINGIQVSINRVSSANTGGNSVQDNVVSLIKGGNVVTGTGSNKATTSSWPTSMGTASYGSTSDTWGTTWTPADINASNFGVALSVLNQSSFGSRTASVDYIRVTVTYTPDTTPPTVTINQAAAQTDPTSASPINFTVVFSESVSDFATGDVTLSGTASATTATVTGSSTTYNVAVSGMVASGTVIANINAGVAHDAAGNANTAATHTDNTVTYNAPATTGTLSVKKTINNAGGGIGAATDFSFHVNSGATTTFEADGQNDLTELPGSYTVTENTVAGYTASYNNCTSVSVTVGTSTLCAITNTYNPPAVVPGNLILNPSFESGPSLTSNSATSWTTNVGAGTSATFSIVPGRSGSRAAEVTVSSPATNADAKWLHQTITVSQGQYYTFSFWYKSTAPAQVNYSYNDSDFYWAADLPPAADWTQYQTDLLVPSGMNSAALQLMAIATGPGTLTTDDYSLVLGTAPIFSAGMVTLTFDDGWKSFYQNGIPILNADGLKATAYLNSGPILDSYTDYMTPSDVASLVSQSFDIGGHTTDHLDLTTPTATEAFFTAEINADRANLQAMATPEAVDAFAYPFGAYDDTVIAHVASSGYVGARTVDAGYNFTNTDPFKLKIQTVAANTPFNTVKSWIDTATSEKAWLILMLHRVTTSSAACVGIEEECITTSSLQQIADYLKNQHVTTPTMHQGLAVLHGGSIPDTIPPSLAEVTPVPSSTNDNTPNYTFSSSEAGTILYAGDCSATITAAVASNNTVTFNTLTDGLHNNCTIRVRDAANNTSTALAVTAFTVDATPPIITINPYPTSTTNQDITVTASTNEGTLNATSTTFTANNSFTFIATDTAGNVASTTVTITNIDKVAPVITLNGSASTTVQVHSGAFVDPLAVVTDNHDASSTISGTGVVNTDIVGLYTLHYNATDTAGNAALEVLRSVNVIDTQAPVIASHADVVAEATGPTGATVDYGTPTATDNYDATVTVTCVPPTNSLFALATTTVNCSATDSSTNTATSSFSITVRDTTAPALILNGSSTVTIEAGTDYIDAGATASDIVDGNLTSQIATSTDLNANVVGNYSETYSVADAHGNAASTTRAINVAARPITATADQKSKTYGESDPALTYQVTGSLMTGDAFSGEIARDSGGAVGSYTIGQGTLVLNSNYALTFVTSTLTINAKALTVSATADDKVYDGTANATAHLTTDALGADDVIATGTATFADANIGTAKPVTVNSISISGADAANYALSNTTATTTASITAASVTVSATADNKVYDGATTATAHLTVNGVIGSDDVGATSTDAAFDDVNIGIGKNVTVNGIALAGAEATNYSLANMTATTTADITSAAATVSATGHDKIYDGTTAATADLTVSGTVNGDILTATGTAAFEDAIVGTGKPVHVTGITLEGTNAGNYSVNTATDTIANITAASATVSLGNLDQIYDGTPKSVSTSTTPGGLTVDVTYNGSATAPTDASSSYEVVATINNPNYTGSATGTLVINPEAIAAAADAKGKVFGEPDPALTYQVTSGTLASGDNFTGELSRDLGEDVGLYAINQNTLALSANYTLTFVTSTLTISPDGSVTNITNAADLTSTSSMVGEPYIVQWSVTPAATSSTSTPSGTVTILVDGNPGCSDAVATGQCSVTATSSGNPILVASYGGDANYGMSTSTPVTHTVNKASTEITITNASDLSTTSSSVGQPYTVKWSVSVTLPGAGTPTGNVTISGGSGCTAAVDAGQCDVTSMEASDKTLVASYEGDANFTNSTSSGTAHTVDKGNQTIDFAPLSDKVFSDPDFDVSATSSVGLVPVTFAATGTCEMVSSTTVHLTGVGLCAVTASQAGDANYNAAPAVALSFNVNAAAIDIAPDSLPVGTLGVVYPVQTVTASTTAPAPFTWSIAGGSLPGGLTLDTTATGTTATISGTPNASGTFPVQIQVNNDFGSSATKDYAITIEGAPSISFLPTSLPAVPWA